MKDFFSRDNILIQAASDEEGGSDKKKSKKGDGINAILVFLKEVRDFQERLESCVEAQDVEPIAEKIRSFDAHIDEMYSSLLDIVSTNRKSLRNKGEQPEQPAQQAQPSGKSPLLMGVPSVPKL